MPNRMFRIAWRSSNTNYTGQGQYCLPEEVAELYMQRLNVEHPDIHHWIEPSPPPPLNLAGYVCSYGDDTFVPSTPSPQPRD